MLILTTLLQISLYYIIEQSQVKYNKIYSDKQNPIFFWFLPYRCFAITNIYYDRQTQQCFLLTCYFFNYMMSL